MKKNLLIITLLIAGIATKGQDRIVSLPDSAMIVTDDIGNFWNAFDLLQKQRTLTDSLRIIKEVFVGRASEGLRQYMEAANCHEKEYLEVIKKRKEDYIRIRGKTMAVTGQKKILLSYLRKFKALYPSLKIPTICFTIGKFEVGGTQFPNTLYIGTEKNSQSGTDVMAQAIHELAHFQQKNPDPVSNSDLALIEGGAEYVSFRVTSKRTIADAWIYGSSHQSAIMNEFKSVSASAIDMSWFLDRDDQINKRPGNLGYFIGYKIVESYVNSHQSSRAAFERVVEMKDPAVILSEGFK